MTQLLHEERQHVAVWVHLVIAVALGGTIVSLFLTPEETSPWWLVIPGVILIALYLLFTPMTVEIHSDGMYARFGCIGWP